MTYVCEIESFWELDYPADVHVVVGGDPRDTQRKESFAFPPLHPHALKQIAQGVWQSGAGVIPADGCALVRLDKREAGARASPP